MKFFPIKNEKKLIQNYELKYYEYNYEQKNMCN